MKKHIYIKPEIIILEVYLEESFASGSTITFGGTTSDSTPDIQDWENTAGNTGGGFTL